MFDNVLNFFAIRDLKLLLYSGKFLKGLIFEISKMVKHFQKYFFEIAR